MATERKTLINFSQAEIEGFKERREYLVNSIEDLELLAEAGEDIHELRREAEKGIGKIDAILRVYERANT